MTEQSPPFTHRYTSRRYLYAARIIALLDKRRVDECPACVHYSINHPRRPWHRPIHQAVSVDQMNPSINS
jgi:hypothetical protein